jgi:hypothetical protein
MGWEFGPSNIHPNSYLLAWAAGLTKSYVIFFSFLIIMATTLSIIDLFSSLK